LDDDRIVQKSFANTDFGEEREFGRGGVRNKGAVYNHKTMARENLRESEIEVDGVGGIGGVEGIIFFFHTEKRGSGEGTVKVHCEEDGKNRNRGEK
jgi:hypothetical protein